MPDTFRIEPDIPFPGKQSDAGRPHLYPFAEMAVGDSFFVPSTEQYFSAVRGLSSSLGAARRKTGFNLVWARVENGFRIWRLEGQYQARVNKGPNRLAASLRKRNGAAR
jgi:hypothetical protein